MEHHIAAHETRRFSRFIAAGLISSAALSACSSSAEAAPPSPVPITQEVSAPPLAPPAPETIQDSGAQLQNAWTNYMNDRDGNVSVAAMDLTTGQRADYTHGNGPFYMASTVKLSIFEKLMIINQNSPADEQCNGAPLTCEQLDNVTPMIQVSDNDSAHRLLTMIGNRDGMQSFFSSIGAAATIPDSTGFGLTQTTSADQLLVLQQLTSANSLLEPASAMAIRDQLDHVTADQRWGIGSGLPAGVQFENKNGWLPNTNKTFNSIGIIMDKLGRPRYIMAMFANGASESYTKDTLGHLSEAAYTYFGDK